MQTQMQTWANDIGNAVSLLSGHPGVTEKLIILRTLNLLAENIKLAARILDYE